MEGPKMSFLDCYSNFLRIADEYTSPFPRTSSGYDVQYASFWVY